MIMKPDVRALASLEKMNSPPSTASFCAPARYCYSLLFPRIRGTREVQGGTFESRLKARCCRIVRRCFNGFAGSVTSRGDGEDIYICIEAVCSDVLISIRCDCARCVSRNISFSRVKRTKGKKETLKGVSFLFSFLKSNG